MRNASVQTSVSLAQLEEKIADARALLTRRKAELHLAQQEAKRVERLFGLEAVSVRRVEVATSSQEIAAAQMESATENLNALLKARENVTTSRTALDLEDNRLPLYSPGTGTVVEVTAASGAFFPVDQTLFRIVDLSHVWIRGEVHQSDVAQVQEATSALVQLPGGSQLEVGKARDRLLLVGDVLDPLTRTLPIIWEVTNTERKLKVGLLLSVRVFTRQTQQGLTVPLSAVFREENKEVVYVQVAGATFSRRVVETGAEDGESVLIQTGLSEGERVVVEGGYEVGLAARSSDTVGAGHVH